jgi:hypothetical protein
MFKKTPMPEDTPPVTRASLGIRSCRECGQVYDEWRLHVVVTEVACYDHTLLYKEMTRAYFCPTHKRPYDVIRVDYGDRRNFDTAITTYHVKQSPLRQVTEEGADNEGVQPTNQMASDASGSTGVPKVARRHRAQPRS